MKNTLFLIKKNIFFFLFVAYSFALTAQETPLQHQKDSILHQINLLQGKAKLEAYNDLITKLFYKEQNVDTVVIYFEKYMHEAKNQNDVKREGAIKQNIIFLLNNRGKYQEALKRKDEALEFFLKNKLYSFYIETSVVLIKAYKSSGNMEKAMEEAKLFYEKAKSIDDPEAIPSALFSMGLIYTESNRFADAEVMFRQCLDEARKTSKILKISLEAYFNCTSVCILQHKTKEAEALLKDWEHDLITYEKQEGPEENLFWVNLCQMNLKLYGELKNYKKVEYYCDLLEKKDSVNKNIKESVAYQRMKMYYNLDNYNKSLEYARQGLELVKGSLQKELVFNGNIAYALCYLGRTDEGLTAFNKVIELTDSISKVKFHAQLDELRVTYEVDKLTAQKEANRNYMFMALGGCLLLLMALIIYIVYSRRLKAKNRALYAQIQERIQKEKVAEKVLVQLPEERLSREMLLFRQVSEFMQKEKLFTDPDINRKKLADKLGTNEMYLADAIREGTGQTFSEYIATLRLHYALELLGNHPEMTLEAIAVDSGHGSYSPFFRTFGKMYGMSPSEYRKLSATEKKQ